MDKHLTWSMKMFTIDSERQFKWENIVSDTNCESLNQIAYFKLGKHNNWPENYVKTTMKEFFRQGQNIKWLSQHMPLITSWMSFCDFTKWLLVVDKRYFDFCSEEPFTPIWHTGTLGNKQKLICFNSCIYCWGYNQQNIWKPSGMDI